MIVIEQKDGGLLLVRQRDHAATSGQIAHAWDAPNVFPPPSWKAVIDATARHDDGWRMLEDEPPLDARGTPYDFKRLPTEIHLQVWRKSVELIEPDKPLVSLLIAQHARWLYTHFSRETTQHELQISQRFIDQMTLLIAAHLQHLMTQPEEHRRAVAPENLQIARRLLSFFDFLSLWLIGAMGDAGFSEPVAFAGRQDIITLKRDARDSSLIHVQPWPFMQKSVRLEAVVRELEQKQFENSFELAAEMKATPARVLQWTLRPAASSHDAKPRP